MISDLGRLRKEVQDLGDLFNKRMDYVERLMLRRYAPLPPDHHCPKCGAALSQAVSDWVWRRRIGMWIHNCGGRSWGPESVLCAKDCARPDSEPLPVEQSEDKPCAG